MIKLIMKILNAGVPSAMPPIDQRYIRITNAINLIFIFIISIPLSISINYLTNDGFKSYSRFILLSTAALLNILLNAYHNHMASKISTVIMPFLCVIVFPVLILDFYHGGMFFWIPYGIIIFGTIPFFVFSLEKERGIMVSMILFYLLAAFIFDEMLMLIFRKKIDIAFIDTYYVYYLLPKIIIVVFLYTILFFFKLIYYKNKTEMLLLSQELDDKNKLLEMVNLPLETKVKERTEKLNLQNQRIKELAFVNAHRIRAYVARIIGLLNVLKFKNSEVEKEFFTNKISESAIDLDNITKRLSNELTEEHCSS